MRPLDHPLDHLLVTEVDAVEHPNRHNETLQDLDLLIELERPSRISLIGLIEMEMYLSELLGVKVDVAIKKNLRPRIGRRILEEVVAV